MEGERHYTSKQAKEIVSQLAVSHRASLRDMAGSVPDHHNEAIIVNCQLQTGACQGRLPSASVEILSPLLAYLCSVSPLPP